MYAAMVDGGSSGSNAFLVMLALLELCAAGMASSKRRRVLLVLSLCMALASQVGCHTGGGVSAPSGVVSSTQTAMQVSAMTANDDPIVVAGLPVVMGTVSVTAQ
jgi:hypothetical protein